MEKYLIVSLIFLICCQSPDKESIVQSNKVYSDCSPMIQFVTKRDEATASLSEQTHFRMQRQFIIASGLPPLDQLKTWKKSNNINQAIELYKAYRQRNYSHKFINVFRQYGSYLVLAQMGLLSEKNASEKIYFFVNELADTKYEGGCLIYNSLLALKIQQFDPERLRKCKARFMEYLQYYKPPSDTTNQHMLNPLPAAKRKMLQRSRIVHKENVEFISLLSGI